MRILGLLWVVDQSRLAAQSLHDVASVTVALVAVVLKTIGLADALSLCLLIRDDDPMRYDRAAVRWIALLLDRDRTLHLGDLRELADLLVGVGGHDQIAVLRLERWLRGRGFDAAADRVA